MRSVPLPLGAFLLFGLAVLTDFLLPPPTRHFDLENVGTSSAAAGPDRPASFSQSTALEGVSEISIAARFNATDDNYDNIFQTADGPDAIRLEFTHPNRLNLALSDRRYFLVAQNLSLNQWHEFRLHAVKGRFIELMIDRAPAFRTTDPELVDLRYRIGLITIGSGYSRLRPFQGAIADFALTATYAAGTRAADVVLAIATFALFAVFVRQLTRPRSRHDSARPFGSEAQRFGPVILLLVASGAAGWWLAGAEPRIGKWNLLLFPLLATLALLATSANRPEPRSGRALSNLLTWPGVGVIVVLALFGAQKVVFGAGLPFLGRLVPLGGALGATAAFAQWRHPENSKARWGAGLVGFAFSLVAW